MNGIIAKKFIFLFYFISIIIFFGFLYYFNLLNFLNEDFKFSDSYNLIKNFREENLILSIFIFFIFTIIWTFFLGFGSPISILSALIFEIKLGFIIALLSSSVGATFFYLFFKSLTKEIVKDKLKYKYSKYLKLINKNNFLYFTVLRMIPGIPFQVLNILPILINMKIIVFFIATIIGSSFSKFFIILLSNEIFLNLSLNYSLLNILLSPRFLIIILIFILFILISFIIGKKFIHD